MYTLIAVPCFAVIFLIGFVLLHVPILFAITNLPLFTDSLGSFNENKNQTAAACNDTIQIYARYLKESSWPCDEGATGSSALSGLEVQTTWQPFCDLLLVGKGNVAECLIANKSTGQVIASALSASVKKKYEAEGGPASFGLLRYAAEQMQEDGSEKLVPVDEGEMLAQLMAKPPGTRPAAGLRLNKVKYQFIKGGLDDVSICNTLHGKKTKGGCVVSATGKLILAATFDEVDGHTAAGCAANIADLAKYLVFCGY